MKLIKQSLQVALLLPALMVGVANAEQAGVQSTLQQAYQKEFAFLETQKHELEKRLAEIVSKSRRDETQLRDEIKEWEVKALDMELTSERLGELAVEAERQIEVNQSNKDALQSTFDQAEASLADYQVKLTEQSDYDLQGASDHRLSQLYHIAAQSIARMSGIYREEGSFFLADGAQVDGTLLRIGNVAALGSSPQGGGVLAPAGAGEFKVWGENTKIDIDQLLRGDGPATLSLFLFESLNKGVEVSKEEGAIAVIESGGVIAWTIVTLGLLGLLLVILRGFFLMGASTATGKVDRKVSKLVAEGKRDEAMAYCKKLKGSTSRVVADTLRNLDRDRDHLEDIISESILHESSTLNRFGAFIMVIAAVSPLLGLLGTVTGMIATFDVITEFGTGDPKLLSGGISTALVTTELGLIVAIPILILGTLLNAWSNRIKDEMEKAALHISNASLGSTAGIPLVGQDKACTNY